MEVHSVTFTREEHTETVRLRDVGDDANGNCFTVINGVNGTGKSAILRIISDAALGLNNSKQYKLYSRDIKIDAIGPVSRVIAISGTHNDRFPINSGIEIRANLNQFDLKKFYYYGPKQSGNYTSAAKASNAIAHSLLTEGGTEYFPGFGVTSLFEYLGFAPVIYVDLQFGNRVRSTDMAEYLEKIRTVLDTLEHERDDETKIPKRIYASITHAKEIVTSPDFGTFLRDSKGGQQLFFDLHTGPLGLAIYGDPFFDFIAKDWDVRRDHLLADLIALGVFSTRVSFVRKSTGKKVFLEDLSSGQWQLIYSLLNLSLNLVDNSLVLIDEPENSLHPQWQSDYVSLLRKLVGHRDGCHVIIATHSPLIAASIMPEDGNLVRFEHAEAHGGLHVEMEDAAYGWLPEDILKDRFDMASVRPPELTRVTNAALQLLKTSSEPTKKLRSYATHIKHFMRFLPLHDPLRPVLTAIVAIAFPQS